MTDSEIKNKEGEYFDENHYKLILNEDADVYTESGILLLKLRKKCLSNKVCIDAVNSLRSAAKKKARK